MRVCCFGISMRPDADFVHAIGYMDGPDNLLSGSEGQEVPVHMI